MSPADTQFNVRFVGTVIVRTTGKNQSALTGKFFHLDFLTGSIGGIDGFQSDNARIAEVVHKLIHRFFSEVV